MSAKPREGVDFFPLSVDFEEKLYSVGKIPGSFQRREGRASEKAVLCSRVIGRPIRPLFPKDMRNDVGVVATVMSVDPDCQPEITAMLGVSIAISISEIPWDGQRMRQVFLNVLDNAAKHGRDGKRIEDSMSLEGDYVVVRIRDFGPGIPEDELGLVKKKFYKGSSKARGTGIGLAVCEEIMQLHNGSLTLENAKGGGTLVTISLPVTQ